MAKPDYKITKDGRICANPGCRCAGVWRERDQFYTHTMNHFGISSRCIECNKQAAKDRSPKRTSIRDKEESLTTIDFTMANKFLQGGMGK
jgi:hypothetical protein